MGNYDIYRYFVEPKQMLYWNILHLKQQVYFSCRTETNVVLKCQTIRYFFSVISVEPKQMLYWNILFLIFQIETKSVEPKQMLYWNSLKIIKFFFWFKSNRNKCCIEILFDFGSFGCYILSNRNKCCIEIIDADDKEFQEYESNRNKCCIEINLYG